MTIAAANIVLIALYELPLRLIVTWQVFFLDYDKRQYLSAFKLIEQSGLLKPVRPSWKNAIACCNH